MKKLIAMVLVLMLAMATASAAEWNEGLGPNRPYENNPAVDFEQNIGYMICHPNSAMSVAGTKTLFIYLPREDVQAGSGKLTLRSADLGEEYSVNLNDATAVVQRAAMEDELAGLMWGSGTCFEIRLPVSLRIGTTYYVDLERDSIVDQARPIGNATINSNEGVNWYFATVADYGVSAMEYRRPTDEEGVYENQILAPQAGDEVRFDLVLGGAAKSATIVIPTDGKDSVTFKQVTFTESCEVLGDVTGTDPIWDVIFWDTEVPPTNVDYDHIVAWLEF